MYIAVDLQANDLTNKVSKNYYYNQEMDRTYTHYVALHFSL